MKTLLPLRAGRALTAPSNHATVIDVQSRIVVIQGDRVEFTSKEFDLLCFFAKYPNWALTRGQILDSVWDDSPAATYHAVENTILEQTT